MADEEKFSFIDALKRIQEKIKDYTPAHIDTPMGPYETSQEIADEYEIWCKETEGVYEGAMGGKLSFEFTTTSMGLILVIKDAISKKEFNATSYDTW